MKSRTKTTLILVATLSCLSTAFFTISSTVTTPIESGVDQDLRVDTLKQSLHSKLNSRQWTHSIAPDEASKRFESNLESESSDELSADPVQESNHPHSEQLAKTIARIEQNLDANDIITRLNRNELSEDEREKLKETFSQLNELRSKQVKSTLRKIEEKLQVLEEKRSHV